MARSHESLWLAASAAFTAVAVALLSVNATFDADRAHYTFWTSGLMVIVYVTGVLAILCFAGAIRRWTVPLSGDRPHRGASADPAEAPVQLAEPELASADLGAVAPGPVITDQWRQTSDGGKVPALMSLTHTIMFHPGYGGRQAQDTPPSVKIGMLVACQPIDAAASGTELRARFAAFLETEAVMTLIGSLTPILTPECHGRAWRETARGHWRLPP